MVRKKKSKKRKGHSAKKRPASKPKIRQKQPYQPLDWPIPSAANRARIIEHLTARGNKRSPAESWKLGRLHVYEGCIEEDDSRLDDGVELLMEAASAESPYPKAVLDLSWVMMLRGLYSMALPHAKRATQLMPECRDAWAFYGRACVDRGRLDEALRAIETACALPDAINEDRQLLDRLRAGEPFEKGANIVSFFTRDTTALHLETAQSQETLKYQLFILRQLLKTDPSNEWFLYASALNRYKLNQFDRAREFVERLVWLNDAHADGLTLLALINAKTEQIDAAITFYRRAVEAEEGHVLANTNLAKHLIDEGALVEARTHLGRALATDPKYGIALHLYGNSIALVEQDYEKEATYHRRALEQEPNRPEFHLSYCMSLLQQGDFRALERAWRKGKRFISTIKSDNVPFAQLIPVLLDPPSDPSLWNTILTVKDSLGGAAVSRAVERMLRGVPRYAPEEELSGAYSDVGMLAGQCELHQLSLRAFLKVEQIEGRGTTASLNVAVALNWLGRNAEAVERASEVSPEGPRAQTILGNLLRDAGQIEEAFECYQRAVRIDIGFLLPIQSGTEIGCWLRRWNDVEELQTALQYVQDQELTCALIRSALFASQGMPWKVVEVLEEPLITAAKAEGADHLPEALREIIHTDPSSGQMFLSEEHYADVLERPDLFGGRDLTLLGGGDTLKKAWFAVAEGLWGCGHTKRALRILQQGVEHSQVQPDGDWGVLKAECLRLASEPEMARQIVDSMNPQPPPLITSALLSLAEGETTTAVELIARASQLEIEGRYYHHPLGETRALEKAIMSFGATEAGELKDAEMHARQAYDLDRDSAFCVLALMTCLEAQGEAEAGLNVGREALQAQPGDPELVRWCVETYLDQGQVENADTLLKEQRQSMELRSADALAAQLGETVAREKLQSLDKPTMESHAARAADWPWLDHLQPAARRWLQTAVLHADRVQWLRLGLAFYLCKVAEMELVHRLVLPFEAKVQGKRLDFDRRLRDLATYLQEGGRPPSLGGISQALRIGAERGHHRDGTLIREWRSFIRSRAWQGSRMLVSRSFLSRLDQLRRARNRVAHLGDLTKDDFTDLYSFMVDEEGPGDFFKALGVGDFG